MTAEKRSGVQRAAARSHSDEVQTIQEDSGEVCVREELRSCIRSIGHTQKQLTSEGNSFKRQTPCGSVEVLSTVMLPKVLVTTTPAGLGKIATFDVFMENYN